jgi:hypothetical protein
VIFLTLLSGLLFWADPVAVYRGAVVFPGDVFAPDGSSVSQGKHDFEIRVRDDRYVLAFPGPERQTVTIPGKPYKELDSFTIPVVGTLLLWPVKEPPPDESRSKTSPYLTNLDWHATLRIYRSSNPESAELRAVFQEGTRRIEFAMFSAKPPAAARKP